MLNTIKDQMMDQLNSRELKEYLTALNKYINILDKSYVKFKKKLNGNKPNCLHMQCHAETQKCHLLQRKGILTNISNDSHLMQLQIKDIFKWQKNLNSTIMPLEMKKIGIKNAFSGKLFCNEHDEKFFKSIEKTDLNPYDYNTQILLAYRSICHEIRQKMDNIEFFKLTEAEIPQICNFFKSENLSPRVHELMQLAIIQHSPIDQSSIPSTEKSIADLAQLKNEIEKEMVNPQKSFEFICVESKLLPIAASCIISSEIYVETFKINNPYFLQIIPYKNKSYFIIGYNNANRDHWLESYLYAWSIYSEKDIQMECSRLLLTRCLNWCMSTDFYNSFSIEEKNKFYDFHMKFFTNNGELVSIDNWNKVKYNLFSMWIYI